MSNNTTKAGSSKLQWGRWGTASDRPAHALKTCQDVCGLPSDPASGVQLSPSKWICARCWAGRRARKTPAVFLPTTVSGDQT